MTRLLFLLIVYHLSLITSHAEVVWFDGHSPITYQLPRQVEPVVVTALEMWKDDMRQVTGFEPVAARRAKVRLVRGRQPADGFCIYTSGSQIIIEGGNGRGMAYGLLELSRLAGVSPWIWWGDVVPERKSRLVMASDFVSRQQPSVAFRGIFLNDEDWSLRPWSQTTHDPSPTGQIGVATYKRIFQLLLRLRANALWPGMHGGTKAFFLMPGAKAMADSCGIVIGTSHCEPLLRNNVGEWDASERGPFNYRTNRHQVQSYWIERLKQVSHSSDNMFTIGMRGIHDSSMEGYTTEQEKFDALQQVIDDQQQLLRRYVGDPSRLMQVFVPYKEVLQLYEKGLRVPDYVTLMWCDDNYGYITRLSDAREQQRQGGAGVYYHLSYWGRPHDYLWLTTTQPGLIYSEMRQAYDHNARRLWIANVHDPKVAGYQLELFLDMAWNIDCVNHQSLGDHYQRWLCRQFGDEAGRRLFPVMHEFYRLCGIRRPEFMGWSQVELDKKVYPRGLSPVRDSDWPQAQCDSFESSFLRLSREVQQIAATVRPALRDAYFAAIQYPVEAAAAHAEKLFEAQRARRYADGTILSDTTQTPRLIAEAESRSQAAYDRIHQLTDYYNNQLAGGKWKNLMCDHPRDLPVFGALPQSLPKGGEERKHSNGSKGETIYPCEGSVAIYSPPYREGQGGGSAGEVCWPIGFLGHSMNAVGLSRGGWLSCPFTVERESDYVITVALIPTHPLDGGDLRFSVAVDDSQPAVFSLKEPFRSEQWKLNVLSGQARRSLTLRIPAGPHQLTVRALDDHIVVDQIFIEFIVHSS